MTLRDLEEGIHLRYATIQMDRNNRLRAGRDRALDHGRVDVMVFANIYEHRRRAGVVNRGDRRHKGVRDRYNFVAWSDAGRAKAEVQGVGAVTRSHRVR